MFSGLLCLIAAGMVIRIGRAAPTDARPRPHRLRPRPGPLVRRHRCTVLCRLLPTQNQSPLTIHQSETRTVRLDARCRGWALLVGPPIAHARAARPPPHGGPATRLALARHPRKRALAAAALRQLAGVAVPLVVALAGRAPRCPGARRGRRHGPAGAVRAARVGRRGARRRGLRQRATAGRAARGGPRPLLRAGGPVRRRDPGARSRRRASSAGRRRPTAPS